MQERHQAAHFFKSMFRLDGQKAERDKLIHAYMKRENIDFTEFDNLLQLSFDEFVKLVNEKYEIKGKLNWKSMSKARKIGHELSEHEIQVLVVKYLKSNNIGHFAVPNGFVTDKGPAYINYMKAEGLKNGVPDLVILYGDGNVAFLELKTNKGKLSEHQQKWHKWLNNNNYLIKTCYGYDEAIKFIDSLLTM